MVNYTLQKCKTRAGYSAKTPNPIQLNLKKIAQEFDVVMETPVLVVIKEKGVEVIVHGYGELLFKECTDEELMDEIARNVYDYGTQ